MTSIKPNITLNILARIIVTASLFILAFHSVVILTDGDGLPGYSSDYSALGGNDTESDSNTTTTETEGSSGDLRALIGGASSEGTVTNVSSSSTLIVDINGNETVVHAAGVSVPEVTESASAERQACLEDVQSDGMNAIDERYNGEAVIVWPVAGESVDDDEVSAYVYSAEDTSEVSMTAFMLENGFAVVDSSSRPDTVADEMWEDIQDSHRTHMSVADGLNRGLWAC